MRQANLRAKWKHALCSTAARLFVICCLALPPFTLPARAELQFDVFIGYDGVVREGAWFPVACEVHNDGPSFNAVFELSAGALGSDQVRRVPIELPTNTRKRFAIPVFASGGRLYQWDAILLDDRGRIRAERPNQQPRVLPSEGFMLGAMARTFAGIPALPEGRKERPDLKPVVARMQPEHFPDNPIALEGLDALYLNSERALALKVNQITALLAWVYEGGRLVVVAEQLTDVNSTPWLQQLLPCELTEMVNVTIDEALLQWLRREGAQETASAPPTRRRINAPRMTNQGMVGNEVLNADPNFFDVEAPVATGQLRDGSVTLSAQGRPLVIEANRGRGQVILLTFSPEREPFRSWKHRSLFWATLLDVPPIPVEHSAYGGFSLDGVFGAMIYTDQVRNLPVKWLLLLLLVYLVVIGPLDQYWLKKINRPMLTWITFPSYVVLFSLLIYFIGYKLRAGETEWNELQVVDVLPRGERTALRGRTYASLYSSSNARYKLAFTPTSPEAAEQSYASLRGELLDLNRSGSREGSRADVEQQGNMFRADIFVPVWTSLLYINDWFQPAAPPLSASLVHRDDGVDLEVENRLERPLADARVAYRGLIYDLGSLRAGQKRTFPLDPSAGVPLQQWVMQHGAEFQSAAQSRHSAFGDSSQIRFENLPLAAMVASFVGQLPKAEFQRTYIAPPGFELSPLLERGDAVLLAWDANHSYTQPINRFQPPRYQRNSLLRLAVPAPANADLQP